MSSCSLLGGLGWRTLAASLAGAGILAFATPARTVAFTVNVTTDGGDTNLADTPNLCDSDPATAGEQCSLRAAIQEANNTAGFDPISFKIPGAGVHKILPADVLPVVTGQTTIDGYTQPGAEANTLPLGQGTNAVIQIELAGTVTSEPFPLSDPAFGLRIDAAGSTVRGLAINRFHVGLGMLEAGSADGNFIGTDAGGTKAKPNRSQGIFVSVPTGVVTIGGATPAARNLISANGREGILTNDPVNVQGNLIGTGRDGRSALGNGDAGAELFGTGSTVGGLGDAGNIIAFNGGSGVSAVNPTSQNLITGNRIFSNGGLGIDLGDDGRTLNDPQDADTGPNGLQNFPILKSAVITAPNQMTIKTVLKSKPNTAYTIEWFSNPRHGRQAKKFLGAVTSVLTDAEGKKTLVVLMSPVSAGKTITATATDPSGRTSEISDPVTVIEGF